MSDVPTEEFQHDITKGDQAKEDMAMMMQPFTQMEGQLSAAPLCLSILGHLCLVATGRDFSLVESAKESATKMKHLTHPESFRASLCQVSNEGYLAFLEADKVMDIIRLSTYQVPTLMSQSLRILFEADDGEVEELLPISLGRIKEIAQSCTREAEKVVEKYKKVIDTLQELQVASLARQGKTEEAKQAADFAAQQTEAEQKAVKEMKEKIDSNSEALQKHLKEAQREYRTALDDTPGVMTMIGLALTDSVCSVINALSFSSVSGIAGAGARNAGGGVPDVDEGHDNDISPADIMLYSHAKDLHEKVVSMARFFTETNDGVALDDNVIQGRNADKAYFSAPELASCMDMKSRCIQVEKGRGGNATLAANLVKVCDSAKMLAKDIDEASRNNSATANQVKKFNTKYQQIAKTIREISTVQCSVRLNVPATPKRGPGILQKAKALAASNGGKKSLVESHLQTAHMKIEVASAQLRATEARADEAMEKQLEANRRLQEIMLKISTFKAESATHAEIMVVLQEGLKAFGKRKEQWDKLLAFFQMMTNLINTSLGPPMQSFVDYAESSGRRRLKGFTPSDCSKELIYQTASEADKVAYLVHCLSGTYCTVSRGHLP